MYDMDKVLKAKELLINDEYEVVNILLSSNGMCRVKGKDESGNIYTDWISIRNANKIVAECYGENKNLTNF